MKIAISPCPNDTFLFYPWISGQVGILPPPEVIFADIQQLNEWALQAAFPLIKLSIPCFAQVAEHYQLLPVGCALGFGCGPKIISKTAFPLTELTQKTVAIPGKETTAHHLLNRLLPPPKEKIFCLYHEIAPLIAEQVADCGVVIHESRFTYKQAGFLEIADLGELWEKQSSSPLPLGGLAINRSLPEETKKALCQSVRASLALSYTNPSGLLPFMLHHAQEKEPAIVHQHIQTYVTCETEQLSEQGARAIERLVDCALPEDWLYSTA